MVLSVTMYLSFLTKYVHGVEVRLSYLKKNFQLNSWNRDIDHNYFQAS